MRRLSSLIVTGLTLWACGDGSIDDPRQPEKHPPVVTALYEGVWRVEVSEVVRLAEVCEGNVTTRVDGVTSECPSSVTIPTQTGANFGGDFLIRVSPDFIGWFDDVWGTLTGTVDTTGDVTLAVSVVDGGVNAFEDLTGCTGIQGDSVFSGTVSSGTLRFSATFVSQCVSAIDSSQVLPQWTMEFTGVASPLDVASAAVTINPASVTIQSGSSTQLAVTVEDDSGFVLTDPLVAWSSGDTAIARVTPEGVVSVVEVGTTAVTARVAGRSAAGSVTVSGFIFSSVSAGDFFSCGVTTDGGACWGNGRRGQLGNGTMDEFRFSPVTIAGGVPLKSIAAGGYHVCGLTSDGTAFCWGNNDAGQLGDGSTTGRTTPTSVPGGLGFRAVTAGGVHSCGVAADGTAYCWGGNGGGQLGDGSTTDRHTPTAVLAGLQFVTLSAGSHTCGLVSGGTAYCWGYNSYGQLGDGSTTDRTTPTPVSGGLAFTTVSAGGSHSCGIAVGGIAYCWGDNGYGQLGDGSTTGRTVPTAVSGGLQFAAMSAGGLHSCGLTVDGTVYCWGWNSDGQLGDGSTTNRYAPTLVAGGITFASVTAGWSHACGLSSQGIAYCWGHGRGTGAGTGLQSTVPVRVAGQP